MKALGAMDPKTSEVCGEKQLKMKEKGVHCEKLEKCGRVELGLMSTPRKPILLLDRGIHLSGPAYGLVEREAAGSIAQHGRRSGMRTHLKCSTGTLYFSP